MDTGQIKDKNILISGLGKTGLSVLSKIHMSAGRVVCMDDNADLVLPENIKKIINKNASKIRLIKGPDLNGEKDILKDIDLVVQSPGIPDSNPVIKKAKSLGIPIWSEIEVAWNMLSETARERSIAVTGTNGKTTVVNIISHILNSCSNKAIACGNVGNPLINTLDDGDDIMRVIEISSFQMEKTFSFKPKIAIILNITSDHINRHGSIYEYAKLKFKIFKNQEEGDFAILNIDDGIIKDEFMKLLKTEKNRNLLLGFSLKKGKYSDAYHDSGSINYSIRGKRGAISTKDCPLKGNHNISNMISAAIAAVLSGVSDVEIEDSLKSFQPLSHRIEHIGIFNGIHCYNDSKSTNPDATIKALECFKEKVTLILGGMDKDMDFTDMLIFLNEKVENLVLIGETTEKLSSQIEEIGHSYNLLTAPDLKKAVEKSFSVTKKGGNILLSPACASMDMFKDYKDRGNKFKQYIKEIND